MTSSHDHAMCAPVASVRLHITYLHTKAMVSAAVRRCACLQLLCVTRIFSKVKGGFLFQVRKWVIDIIMVTTKWIENPTFWAIHWENRTSALGRPVSCNASIYFVLGGVIQLTFFLLLPLSSSQSHTFYIHFNLSVYKSYMGTRGSPVNPVFSRGFPVCLPARDCPQGTSPDRGGRGGLVLGEERWQ